MIELTGTNLGERHHELNKKVYEAFKNKDNFEEISKHEEKSDVDRLFKIDLANLNKNVNYLEETLKCGDPLYISRALKCSCLYDAVHIINPDYVHNNIFPFMSAKMKRKMLTAIAVNVQGQEIIDKFYTYCLSHQLNSIANKFLVRTSQHYKEEYLKTHIDIDDSIKYNFFFGKSYELIDIHIQRKKTLKSNYSVIHDLFRFSYLYSSASDKYLDMLEYCLEDEKCIFQDHFIRFGLRISKDIITKHKHRVLNKMWLYLGLLDKKMITKYSSIEDAKKYAIVIMPETTKEFWLRHLYRSYNYIFEKIPASELYMFLKHIFSSKYPNTLFEMDIRFYRLNYNELMTVDEQHEWALKHIEQKKEHFGPLRDYKWYEFVKFNKAFYEIQRLIYVNKCPDIRSDLIDILVKSASQDDLDTLITYYYERHVNESRRHKERFVDQIIDIHNAFKFHEKCWTVFLKLLHSLGVFDTGHTSKKAMLAVVYNIIHFKLIPQNLEPFCKFKRRSFCIDLEKLDSEQKESVYTFLKDYYTNKISILMEKTDKNDDDKEKIIEFTWSMITLIDGFKKFQEECPEVAMKSIKLYWDEFCYDYWFNTSTKRVSEGDLLRLLKKDKDTLLLEFPKADNFDIRCTNLMKKIRVYFYNDVAKNMTDFFAKKLLELYKDKDYYLDFDSIIFNLFQLADPKFKVNLLNEYAPVTPKIKHDEIDKNLLKIQKSICTFVHYSRPPLPLSNVQKYIQGDYVPFCLPMFNSYLMHLPLPLSLTFIKAILDAPVSIQKHGLRSAFQSFDIDSLKELVIKVWNSTQNVSLRLVIYKAVMNKIKKVSESDQDQLYEPLKMFTLDLGISDQDEIFELLTSSRLPDRFMGDFLVSAWTSVNNLPFDSSIYIDRKSQFITHISNYIEYFERIFCSDIIDDHVNTMLIPKYKVQYDNTYQICMLYEAKWKLAAKYITHFNNNEELKSSLELLNKIMKLCFDTWDEIHNGKYVVREFLFDFLDSIKNSTDYNREIQKKPYINPIFESIVTFFHKYMPINKIIIFDYKLAIQFRNAIGDGLYDTEDKRITYKHLVNENVARDMAKVIMDRVNESYYPSLCDNMAEAIKNNVSDVTNWTNLESDQLIVSVCHNLSKYNHYNVSLLALHILPLEVREEFENDFYATIDMIMESHNEDLNSFIYKKFIMCDYKNRLALRM